MSLKLTHLISIKSFYPDILRYLTVLMSGVGLGGNVEINSTTVVVHQRGKSRGIEIGTGFSIRSGRPLSFGSPDIGFRPFHGDSTFNPIGQGISPAVGKRYNSDQ